MSDRQQKYLQINKPAPPVIIEVAPQPTPDHFKKILEVAPLPIVVPQHLPVRQRPPTIRITMPQSSPSILSYLLDVGRGYHAQCRNAFVEKVQYGYYAYERREEWRTCALAAIYAGAFGSESIQQPEFSYSQAVWRLSQRLGYDIGKRPVVGPTGRHNNLADEIMALNDVNKWSRAGIAEWLASQSL